MLIVIGDFNVEVGWTSVRHPIKTVLGPYSLGERNDRGDRFLKFCIEHVGSYYEHALQQQPRRLYADNRLKVATATK